MLLDIHLHLLVFGCLYVYYCLCQELVQNADDAEAGSIAFLLDSTQHPLTNLYNPEFSPYQGPALYSWNDALFGPRDWEGIQRIGRSIKEKTALKVGRFGLGFVSVYHLTGLSFFPINYTFSVN